MQDESNEHPLAEFDRIGSEAVRGEDIRVPYDVAVDLRGLLRVWEELDDLLARYDADVEFTCASACAWGGQLGLTLPNPKGARPRTTTFSRVGGGPPGDVARGVLDAASAGPREPGPEPMPVPAWMTADEEQDR